MDKEFINVEKQLLSTAIINLKKQLLSTASEIDKLYRCTGSEIDYIPRLLIEIHKLNDKISAATDKVEDILEQECNK